MSKVVMKNSTRMLLVIALAAVVLSAACSKNANTGNSTTSTNTTNSSTTNKNSSTGGDTASGSPTASLRAYYQAAMNKDIPTAKKYLSAGTMRVMEEGAKQMGKSVDEAFEEGAKTTTTMPEFTNEKITGDTATVDIKAQGATVTMPLVKEDGIWKLAMDKLIEDMKNAMGGDATKKPGVADDDDEKEGNHNGGH